MWSTDFTLSLLISNFYFPPIIPQPSEAPKETKEAKQTVAEVEVDKNASQNGHPDVEKKKLNKRERKEARQQKNGKSVKSVEKTAAPEQEEEQAGKKKKKDKKRKRGYEDDGDEEQNGDETSSKKKKTGRENFLSFKSSMLSWKLLSFLYECVEDCFLQINTVFCFVTHALLTMHHRFLDQINCFV